MARLSTNTLPTITPDYTAVNLNRLLARLQQTLDSSDPNAETKLRNSSLERERYGNNLDYAKGLLLKLEREAIGIKIHSKKIETQSELVKKRELLMKMSERLDEINEFATPSDHSDSEGEDLLGEDTPSTTTEEQSASPLEQAEPILSPPASQQPSAVPPLPSPATTTTSPQPETTASYTLRSRKTLTSAREDLFATSTSTSHSPPQDISTTTETLLTHNRSEQEALTSSLLAMATALKESSKAFGSSLEAEKSTLDKTVEGLDKNEMGLESASRRMGHLRSLTEGKGWWGRMLLYAYIAGLAVCAILLVFVGPKLRF